MDKLKPVSIIKEFKKRKGKKIRAWWLMISNQAILHYWKRNWSNNIQLHSWTERERYKREREREIKDALNEWIIAIRDVSSLSFPGKFIWKARKWKEMIQDIYIYIYPSYVLHFHFQELMDWCEESSMRGILRCSQFIIICGWEMKNVGCKPQ